MAANPKLFRELSLPFESSDDADAAIQAFNDDLALIREKHHIANIYCIVAGSMKDGDSESEFMTSMAWGDSLRSQAMTAWAYGRESATHDAIMRQIVSDAMKQVKKR